MPVVLAGVVVAVIAACLWWRRSQPATTPATNPASAPAVPSGTNTSSQDVENPATPGAAPAGGGSALNNAMEQLREKVKEYMGDPERYPLTGTLGSGDPTQQPSDAAMARSIRLSQRQTSEEGGENHPGQAGFARMRPPSVQETPQGQIRTFEPLQYVAPTFDAETQDRQFTPHRSDRGQFDPFAR